MIKTIVIFLALLSTCQLLHASVANNVKTTGSGDNVELDVKRMTPRQKEASKLLKEHCTTCHSEQRIITAINDWLDDGSSYEERLKMMMAKKIRLSKGTLHKGDSQKIFDLLLSFNQHH